MRTVRPCSKLSCRLMAKQESMMCGPKRSGSATRSESHLCALHDLRPPLSPPPNPQPTSPGARSHWVYGLRGIDARLSPVSNNNYSEIKSMRPSPPGLGRGKNRGRPPGKPCPTRRPVRPVRPPSAPNKPRPVAEMETGSVSSARGGVVFFFFFSWHVMSCHVVWC